MYCKFWFNAFKCTRRYENDLKGKEIVIISVEYRNRNTQYSHNHTDTNHKFNHLLRIITDSRSTLPSIMLQ